MAIIKKLELKWLKNNPSVPFLKIMAKAELVHCPVCGIKTIPDHKELEFEDKLCDECYAKMNIESE